MTASHLCAHDRPEAVQVGPQHVLGVAGVEGVVHNHLQVGGPHHHVALHEAAGVVVVVWWVGKGTRDAGGSQQENSACMQILAMFVEAGLRSHAYVHRKQAGKVATTGGTHHGVDDDSVPRVLVPAPPKLAGARHGVLVCSACADVAGARGGPL